MKRYLIWLAIPAWLAVDGMVIRPLTSEFVGTALATLGGILVIKLIAHYRHYGNEGLKFWRWRHQPIPSALDGD